MSILNRSAVRELSLARPWTPSLRPAPGILSGGWTRMEVSRRHTRGVLSRGHLALAEARVDYRQKYKDLLARPRAETRSSAVEGIDAAGQGGDDWNLRRGRRADILRRPCGTDATDSTVSAASARGRSMPSLVHAPPLCPSRNRTSKRLLKSTPT